MKNEFLVTVDYDKDNSALLAYDVALDITHYSYNHNNHQETFLIKPTNAVWNDKATMNLAMIKARCGESFISIRNH